MKARSILLIFIWASWIGILLTLTSFDIAEDQVKHNSGIVREASCITSRSVNGLQLKIIHSDGKLTEEFLNLPGSYECDEDFVVASQGEKIRLSQYKERNVGLTIGDAVILDVQDGIDRANNKHSSIIFSFFLAFTASILILIRQR